MQRAEYFMPSEIVLPHATADLFRKAKKQERHPGLLLDKFSPPEKQKRQRDLIKKLCEARGDSELLASLRERRSRLLQAACTKRFEAATAGPLTLHLARASALENAGIHLHPVYGFACLPGSGLKGMARAYAETVWLTGQSDKKDAWKKILDVFGWSPETDKGKCWKPDNAATPLDSQTGTVVFHEAWPTKWPCLELDIANSHHTKYYGGDREPGDWESPNPVSFISVSPGITFDFAVSLWKADSDDLLDLACEWLQGALVHEGAGAKTHAGYGRFRLVELPEPARPPEQARTISGHRLELVTPAFLAGAEQKADDCDLRPATLRGLLRWWWRTMYAAHLATDDLRRLETAIWGSAEQGAALALAVRQGENKPDVARYDKQQIRRDSSLSELPAGKTAQGLFYASYGMNEKKRIERIQRHYAAPGAAWNVILNARKGAWGRISIEASEILLQGEAALWLLCRYGGVGSKARKGFGSFADIPVDGIGSIDDCKRIGKNLRQKLGLPSFAGSKAFSSLDHMLAELEIPTPWRDHWFALDQLGIAMQEFAREFKHDERKAALGLPRKIHGPDKQPLRHQDHTSHQQPKELRNAKRDQRHASPVHYHLTWAKDDTFIIRITAFPSSVLPDMETSKEMLEKLRQHISEAIKKSAKEHVRKGQKPVESIQPTGVHSGAHFPKPNDRVWTTLLEEKTRKGSWKARHNDSGLEGVIQNSKEMPVGCTPGQHIELIVALCNPNEPNKDNRIAFRWPRPKTTKPDQGAPRGKSRGGGKSRRRR